MLRLRAMARLAASAMNGRRNLEMIGQFVRFARRAERIFHAYKFDWAGISGRKRFRHCAAEPAIDIVIFRRHDSAGFWQHTVRAAQNRLA